MTHLPASIAAGSVLNGEEYAWPLPALPAALDAAIRESIACLGGQFQFRLPDGTYEMYWINADSTDRGRDEPWSDYAERSVGEVRAAFERLVRETDFRAQVQQWPALAKTPSSREDVLGGLVFCAYFISEQEST